MIVPPGLMLATLLAWAFAWGVWCGYAYVPTFVRRWRAWRVDCHGCEGRGVVDIDTTNWRAGQRDCAVCRGTGRRAGRR